MCTPEFDVDYALWSIYLAECRVAKVKPDLSDYKVWLSELEADWKENYEDQQKALGDYYDAEPSELVG